MAKGKPKSRYNNGCEYQEGTWCNLPKGKRCSDCARLKGGGKACEIGIYDAGHKQFNY